MFPQDVPPSDLLVESGVQLGVCGKGSAESLQMASDYLSARQAMNQEELRGTGCSWAEVGSLHSSSWWLGSSHSANVKMEVTNVGGD